MERTIKALKIPNNQAQDADVAGVYKEINSNLINLIKEDKIYPKPLMLCSGGTSSRCASEGHWTLDLREKYNSINFDPLKNEIKIEAGVKMKELIDKLSKENRSFPIGLSGITGIGYILTGGISPLSRKYGLAIDNILEIKGFWGNGDAFELSKPIINSSLREKLEWKGLCGAAPFLSIVTSLKLRTQAKKPILIWETILQSSELSEVILKAENWPNYASLYWSWEENIKVYGIFEIEDKSTLNKIDLLIDNMPNSHNSNKFIIEGLAKLPSFKSNKKEDNISKKYSEIMGLLGKEWGKNSYEIINKLGVLMNQRPDKNCSISSQQLGGHTAQNKDALSSFVHRDAMWKPWITATWQPGDNETRAKSLKWLKKVWETLEPSCPGIHMAQMHQHLSWHSIETNAAFSDWIQKLQSLKSTYDPKGILPPI